MRAVLLAVLGGTAAATSRQIRRAAVAPVVPAVELSTEGKVDLKLLLQDLNKAGGLMSNSTLLKKPEEAIETWLPKCLTHVRQLVDTIDRHYTDVQLETVLIHDCQLSQEFPKTHPSTFETHEACLDFARRLTVARMQELKTGETAQYDEFCKSYYEVAAAPGQAGNETVYPTGPGIQEGDSMLRPQYRYSGGYGYQNGYDQAPAPRPTNPPMESWQQKRMDMQNAPSLKKPKEKESSAAAPSLLAALAISALFA